MGSDNQRKIKLPKKDAMPEISNWSARQRQKNFRDVIIKTKLIEFIRISPWSDEEPSALGIQWFSGMQTPSRLFGYPDQPYWTARSLIFMFGNKRCGFTIRSKRLPYVNFETYLEWRGRKNTASKTH